MLAYLRDFKIKLFAEITIVPAFLRDSHYRSLDGLRGLSIIIVVLSHFGTNQFLKPYNILIDSSLGVHIFFVLSGFLITTLLLKEKIKSGEISLKRFYIRRILRIVPVLYLFLFTLMAFNQYFKLKIEPLDFTFSLLFLKNLPVTGSVFTAHLWSLSVEEQFYLAFPILLAFSTKRYLFLMLFLVTFIPLISILGFNRPDILFANPVVKIFTKISMYSFWEGPIIILIGSLFSILAFKKIIRVENTSKNYFLSLILLVIAIIIHTKTFFFYSKYFSEYLSTAIIGYVILLSQNKRSFLALILNQALFVRIGVLSYSIYVWQQLFIGRQPWQPWLQSWNDYPLEVIIILKIICVALLASASYYLFESKILKLRSKYK